MVFSGVNSSVKRGKTVIENMYYFSENPMLDCNQFIIVDKENDELALFDA